MRNDQRNLAASIRARHVDGQDGLVHHSLLCRPACHLQRRKVFVWILESHLSSRYLELGHVVIDFLVKLIHMNDKDDAQDVSGVQATGTTMEQETVF